MKRIAGVAAVFYRDGDQGTEYELWSDAESRAVERILPSAFDSIDGMDVRALFNHDPNHVLGRTSSGSLTLRVTDEGLYYETEPRDRASYTDVVDMLQTGDVDGSSFSFRATDVRWTTDGDTEVREIRGVELYDVGPVTFPAYQAADSRVRSEARTERDVWRGISKQRGDEQERAATLRELKLSEHKSAT